MAIDTIEKMRALKDEVENQIITDGNQAWVELRNSLDAAIDYQQDKVDAVFRATYGGDL